MKKRNCFINYKALRHSSQTNLSYGLVNCIVGTTFICYSQALDCIEMEREVLAQFWADLFATRNKTPRGSLV